MGKLKPPPIRVVVKTIPAVCKYCGQPLVGNICNNCNLEYETMSHEELEKARREFMNGKRSAESYWDCYRAYWSQFKEQENDTAAQKL